MARLKSWLPIPSQSHFSIRNLPFGIISTPDRSSPRPAVAIGDHALDLQVFTEQNGFSALSMAQPHQHIFSEPNLNAFAALGRPMHRVIREYLQSVLLQDGPFPSVLEKSPSLQQSALVPLKDCTMHLPMHIGDYTDFYAGLHHAHTAGSLFRGPDNALQPNYTHLPVGYHGRASSVVVSGTPIVRPNGQLKLADSPNPVLQPSRKLDLELELGCFVCKPSSLGSPVALRAARAEHLFGLVLLNDWSARDIQAWENVPLGPFNGKNFASSISPWIVLMDALEPFAAPGIARTPSMGPLLPYLRESAADEKSHYDIELQVRLQGRRREGDETATNPTTLSRVSGSNLLFSFPQMLAHHAVGGCNLNVGDLLGSGTISGKGQSEKGCLLERTENGKTEVVLDGGERRTFLEDGDTLTITGCCGSEDDGLVGFGECVGTIEPAVDLGFH